MAGKRTKVILFRVASHLSEPIKYDWLLEQRIVNGPIQTIRRISDDSFKKISVNSDSVVAFMPIKPIYAAKLIKGKKMIPTLFKTLPLPTII